MESTVSDRPWKLIGNEEVVGGGMKALERERKTGHKDRELEKHVIGGDPIIYDNTLGDISCCSAFHDSSKSTVATPAKERR